MASLCTDIKKQKRILYMAKDCSRRTIRLGRMPVKRAESFKTNLEHLIEARKCGSSLDTATMRWVAELPDRMYDGLVKADLLEPRAVAPKEVEPEETELKGPTLGEFVSEYTQGRFDVKLNTRLHYGRGRKHLLDFFGPDKFLSEITPGDADGWRLYLLRRGLGENTCRRMAGLASQFFRAAVRRRLVPSNPFDDLKKAVKGNAEKFYFVTREQAQRVLDSCTDAEWRLIFVLARYGGLRCPSEILALTWGDINWERSRFRVRSSKTEHNEGGESRMVPLFPELLPYLREVFEQAEERSEHVITRYRLNNVNLRTQFQRIIHRAGVECWPKIFQNLRSTRETELAETWPIHVVCSWLGNSRAIAAKHYLQTTEQHFQEAALPLDEAAHFCAQQVPASGGNEQNVTPEGDSESADLPLIAAGCNSLQETQVGDTGIEPVTR